MGWGSLIRGVSGIQIFVPRSRMTCPDVGLLVDVWILRVVTLVFE